MNPPAYQISPGIEPNYASGTVFLGICSTFLDGTGTSTQNKNVAATYTATAQSVPLDWKNATLHDVVPLNSNLNTDSSRIYADLFNEVSESIDLTQTTDPTAHFHKVDLDRGTHSFKLVTDAVELSPDDLKTTLNLSVDNAVSVDSLSLIHI